MTQDFDPAGAASRRAVLGDAHVDKLQGQGSPMDRAWNMYVTNVSWAGTWARQVIDRPTLSLVTLGMLAGAGQMEEFERHVRNALLRTGVSQLHLREVLLHIGHYCGIPTGAACFAIVRKVMREESIAPDAALLEDVGSVYRTAGAAASSF
ncbi:carboxymuconolactone decarboxylase family protein [Acidovorax sp. MR-S7]|uniref:carboxymuconolactone decarboxylase family protein n=1 Tax=Acidovorax sp. MR-S7 TaxID=1268622 RepID=UPI0003718441|nr:carboxymuconolactone decarboxylase family protein [Acidovorax sp. MR-S7]GAD23062.1 gamma-carboxymuconolactone decarboxylase subunit [Acidovorax sp. MR-S7]